MKKPILTFNWFILQQKQLFSKECQIKAHRKFQRYPTTLIQSQFQMVNFFPCLYVWIIYIYDR